MKNKKILFIPADVIKTEVSRSFFFARFMSEGNELYFLSRLDPQNAFFENTKITKWYTLKCFLSSLFSTIRFSKHPKWGYTLVQVPFLSHMVIHHLVGMANALRMARIFNKFQLRRIAKIINPDFIFHAEGFDLYPCLNDYKCFSDIQDDFDSGNFRDNSYNLNYTKKNFLKSALNFVVSNQAAKNLGALYNSNFVCIPNGVERSAMYSVKYDEIPRIKEELGLRNKYIITYIGADAWFNKDLAFQISKLAESCDPSLHFVMVGNLPAFKASNVTFIGPVDKEKSYLFYWLSDIGILFKDSVGSNFLRNSIPLKIIQYGIIGKYFISPPIVWLEQEKFSNVTIIDQFTPEKIVANITLLKSKGLGLKDVKWEKYDWQIIVEELKKNIELN